MAQLPFTVWGEWRFSCRVEKQLNLFASVCAASCGNADDRVRITENPGTSQLAQAPKIMPDNAETECHDVSPVMNDAVHCHEEELDKHTSFVGSICSLSQQLIGTTSSSRLIDLLRNGPLPYEELCKFCETTVSSELQGMSDTIILHFCQSLCSGASEDHEKLVRILCHNLLLPKIRDSNRTFTRPVMATIQLAIENFPSQSCSTLLTPLIISPGPNYSNVETILSSLNDGSKQVTLKCVLERGIHSMKEEQVNYLQKLLPTVPLESSMRSQLIDLVCRSASNLCKSTPFGKFLVSIIKQIGPSCGIVQRDQLSEVVKQHKSLQRRLAEQALQSLTV